MSLSVLILAGGSGTRLWPLSRKYYPKQFLRLIGERSLFQNTLLRAAELTMEDKIYVVGGEIHRDLILGHINEINLSIPLKNVLLEPMGKNTLPAICWATLEIIKRDENSTILVLPSDHLLEGEEFSNAVKIGMDAAESKIVVFGVKPTEPHTGYGYIKPGRERNGWFEVEKFVEKPDYETAIKYLHEGYLWNSGMFLFKGTVLIEECRKYQKDMLSLLKGDVKKGYEEIEAISMDYGIMEHTNRAAVVPLSIRWSDVGSFSALYKVLEKDEEGNVITGDSVVMNSKGNLIHSSRLVAAVDVKDMIVVDSDDALLVAPKSSSEKVRKIVEELEKKGDSRALFHRKIYRPWGAFIVLDEAPGFKVKRLIVYPGKRTSLQKHMHRSEYWTVVRGSGRVVKGREEIEVVPGVSLVISKEEIHRIENTGDEDLEIIEIQIGDYLSEDDIVRIEDDFGRK